MSSGRKSATPEHLFSLYLLLQVVLLLTTGRGHEVIRAFEGRDVVLPCSPSPKINIEGAVFDWKKDGHKEVFFHESGKHYNNGRTGQDKQFKGRISYFPEDLKLGNASITIRDAKMADSGDYTCVFPHINGGQTFKIKLLVERTFKDRSGEIPDAAPKPITGILNATQDGVLLKCEVRGASPEPELEWKDSDGRVLKAEKPQVSLTGGRYYVSLITTVTMTTTNRFLCVATQKNISHEVHEELYVPDKLFESCQGASAWIGAWFSGVLTVAAPLAVTVVVRKKRICCHKGTQQTDGEGDGTTTTRNSTLTESSSV